MEKNQPGGEWVMEMSDFEDKSYDLGDLLWLKEADWGELE